MVGTLFLPLLTLTQTLDSTYDRRALWLAHGPGATGVVQGMGTQAASVGGGTFIPGTDLFETATDRIRSEYGASRAGFKRFTVFGGLQIAGMLATMSYYGGRHHPKWKPGFGIGLPVATFAVGWVGQANAIRGEDHLRRAMWWYNREFPRSVTDSARANCSYDRCALRIRPRVSSHQLVQGALPSCPLARRTRSSSCLRRPYSTPPAATKSSAAFRMDCWFCRTARDIRRCTAPRKRRASSIKRSGFTTAAFRRPCSSS